MTNRYLENVIPAELFNKAGETIPGRLAELLGEVIYNLYEGENNVLNGCTETTDKKLLSDKNQKTPFEWIMKEGSSYRVVTKKLLIEIEHYLEGQAMQEVMDRVKKCF